MEKILDYADEVFADMDLPRICKLIMVIVYVVYPVIVVPFFLAMIGMQGLFGISQNSFTLGVVLVYIAVTILFWVILFRFSNFKSDRLSIKATWIYFFIVYAISGVLVVVDLIALVVCVVGLAVLLSALSYDPFWHYWW